MPNKRRKQKKDDPENLMRFRDEIMHLSEPSDGGGNTYRFQHNESEFALHGKNKLPRKIKRKEERRMKKVKRLAYNQRKPMPKPDEEKVQKKQEEIIEQEKKKIERVKKKKKRSKEKKERKLQQEEEMKKQEMFAAIQREEKTVKQLEKQLHLNKRKSKSLPQSFMDDGLDYLLDVVDKDKVSALYDDSDLEDDLHGHKDKNESDQDISDDDELEEEDDDSLDEDDDEKLKKQTIKQIMSHLKKSQGKLTETKIQKEDGTEAKSILKTTINNDKLENKKSKVQFTETQDDSESESDDNIYDDDLSEEDENLDEGGSNNEDELNESEKVQYSVKRKRNESELHLGEGSDENEEYFSSDDDNDDDFEEDVVTESLISDKNKVKTDLSLKEDIYGRLRDSEGNIVSKATGSYVPPAKRFAMADTMDEKNKLKVERLKKQLKGLINRATESNIGPITTQIETIYTTNSRGDANESLCYIIMEACISPVLMPERLAMELMMLVAILNNNIGMEVGGLFIQQLAQRLKASWEDMEGKYLDNVLLVFAHLYNFKVVHCILIFDIIRKLVERFTEKDIELILLFLKNVGFNLRKDDPHTLKDVILLIQGKATHVDTTDSTRVRFMLEVLLAIKNNNMRKIPNYDPEQFEQMKKTARNHVKASLGSNQLRIGLEDLMNAKDKGRWWVVGSAWEGRTDKLEDPAEKVQTTVLGEMSSKILDLAKKQRMNTGIRKSIFCVIMTSEDYLDAFEKLLRLGLKNLQEREIIHVVTDCCVQEKSFNPFYSFLLQKFCEYDRRFQMTFQFLLWDKFKEMSHQSEQSRHNLGKIVTHLLTTKAISLSVLKVVEFGTLDRNMVRFLKQVLQETLLDYPDQVIQDVFSRIAPLTKLHLLHEGLKLFMRHFLLGKKSKQDQNKVLVERVSLAEKSLSAGQSTFEL